MKKNQYVVNVAPTGIAALKINGTNIHFLMQWDIKDISGNKLKYTDIQYDILSKMSTIIIDEVSFLTNEQHSQLDIQLRRIRKTNKYMGGAK